MYVPSSELDPPTPSPASECVFPLDPKGRGQDSFVDEGVGGTQFGRLDRRAWHSVYSVSEGFVDNYFLLLVYFLYLWKFLAI